MNSTEALAALSPLKGKCRTCNSMYAELMFALGDRRDVARKAARDRRGHDWSEQFAFTKKQLDYALTNAIEHLGEPHAAPEPHGPVGAMSRPVAVDDRPACPACGTKVNVKPSGRINVHQAPSGNRCARKFFEVTVPDLPEPQPLRLIPAAAAADTNSIPPNGSCQGCDKWVPPMRRLCGRCAAHRERAG